MRISASDAFVQNSILTFARTREFVLWGGRVCTVPVPHDRAAALVVTCCWYGCKGVAYCASIRAGWKAEGKKVPVPEQGKALGAGWKALTDAEKAEFK